MTELIFVVEEDPEGGYTARALGPSIFTQATDWDGVKKSVHEAVLCHYEEEASRPKIIRLHIPRGIAAPAL